MIFSQNEISYSQFSLTGSKKDCNNLHYSSKVGLGWQKYFHDHDLCYSYDLCYSGLIKLFEYWKCTQGGAIYDIYSVLV